MVETELPPRAGSALSLRKNVNATYTELQDFDIKERPTSHGISPAVQAWPMQPRPLTVTRQDRIFNTIFDGFLIISPVCLITKTGLCIYAYNIDKSNTGPSLTYASSLSRVLIQLNAQLVTLFTIIFVTTISTFVKRYALWKAQSGAYVSDLEQLQGSISLPSTLKLIWSLRSFGVKSIVLTLVWSFCYLGSQAVKLEYRLSPSANYQDIKTPVQQYNSPSYFTPDLDDILTRNGYPPPDPNDIPTYLETVNIQFGAMILDSMAFDTASQMLSGSSASGPLIPDYYTVASLETSLIDEISRKFEGWIDISEKVRRQGLGSYVSNVGQNLWLDSGPSAADATLNQPDFVPGSFLGTYTLNNISYINITCSHPKVRPAWTFPNGTSPHSSASFNMTTLSSSVARDVNGYPLRQFDYWWRGYTAVPPPELDTSDPSAAGIAGYDPSFNYTLRAVQSTCSLTIKYIDMEVECLSTGCYGSRMRWASDTSEEDATGYSTPFDDDQFATNFFNNFTLLTGVQHDLNTPTLVEMVFFQDMAFNSSLWSTLGPAACRSCDSEMFDYSNLARGLNSYLTLSQAVIATSCGPYVVKILSSETHADDFFIEVEAKGAKPDQGYRLYWQWIPIDFMACSILLAAAIGACWLRVNTLAPDIFGYVSSLTRDNPHLSLPTEASSLSGIERARMLKGVKVRIGDVQGGGVGESSSVGRVGLAPVNAEVRPLHNQGLYM